MTSGKIKSRELHANRAYSCGKIISGIYWFINITWNAPFKKDFSWRFILSITVLHSPLDNWQLVDRKPEPTVLLTQGIFNLLHDIDMVWEQLAFGDTVNYRQWRKSKYAEVMAWGIEPPNFRLEVRLWKMADTLTTPQQKMVDVGRVIASGTLGRLIVRVLILVRVLLSDLQILEVWLVVGVLHHWRSYQDWYRLVTVHTHGDFIVLPHWEMPCQSHDLISHSVRLSLHWANQS